MKRVLFLLAASTFVLSAAGHIQVTKHNLSINSGAYTTSPSAETQICKFCHTPHGAATLSGTGSALKLVQLWGHNSTVSTVFGTPSTDNGGASTFACLSCHDGTVAINNNSNVVTAEGGDIAHLGAMNVTDAFLADGIMIMKKDNKEATHPVNINYTPYQIAGYLNDPVLWTATTGKPRLFNGTTNPTDKYVQCSSCHTVHGDADNVYPALLRASIDGSALCLMCHKK